MFEHPELIPRPKDEVLRHVEGCRNNMHVVRNTGVSGVVQYRLFDCCCYGCITHSENCSQESHADRWITNCMKGKTTVKLKEVNVDNWFRPIIDTSTPNNVEQFETFDKVGETIECHEDEVIEEDSNEYEDCEGLGLQQPDPVFLNDEEKKKKEVTMNTVTKTAMKIVSLLELRNIQVPNSVRMKLSLIMKVI